MDTHCSCPSCDFVQTKNIDERKCQNVFLYCASDNAASVKNLTTNIHTQIVYMKTVQSIKFTALVLLHLSVCRCDESIM